MAHEFETGFFVTEPAWHKLGVVLDAPPTIEEAIEKADLTWSVHTEPLFRKSGPSGWSQVKANCVRRDSDGSVLADHVGEDWTPLQNAEAFNWFNPFVKEGLATLEAAGSLREGRRVWVLAKLAGNDSVVGNDDAIRKYILLSNSHDGSLAVRVGFTPVRVVCANTLSMAIEHEQSRLIRCFHSKNVAANVEALRAAMKAADAAFEASAEQFRDLAKRKISRADLTKYVRIVLQKPEELPAGEKPGRTEAEIIRLFDTGRGANLATARGTWWGAYNAVTEFVSHERGRNADRRLDNVWFGGGRKFISGALEAALKMAA